MQQELLNEAQQLYEEVQKIKIPPEAQADFSNFLRIYNIVKCEKYSLKKIAFYQNLIEGLHQKI